MHRTCRRFWRCYDALSAEAQKTADRAFDLLKSDPRHPSLHFKNVGKLWSVRVGIHYRALAVPDGEDFVWVWIGTHAEYDHLTT